MTSANPSASTPTAQRPAVDLRALISSPLMQQGARPLCVPIAISFAHEAASGPGGDPKAPEAIWWGCSKLGKVGADGMLLEDAARALSLSGQPILSEWPWNPNLGAGTENPPTTVGSPPWECARLQPIALAHDGVEDAVEDCLAAAQPVILVVELTSEFNYPDADGHIEVPDIRSPVGDYHAVVVVGAAHDTQGHRRLLVRNSWGPYWGAGGYGWLPIDYLIANVGPAAVVTL